MVILRTVNGRIMDLYDQRIIDALRRNSRMPYSTIAQELGVSEGMIRGRVRNLINAGVIKRFTIEVCDGREK